MKLFHSLNLIKFIFLDKYKKNFILNFKVKLFKDFKMEETEKNRKEPPFDRTFTKELLEDRTIIISQEIDSKLTNKIITQLLVMNKKDPEKPIKIFINSPGGSADDGFAIFDVIRFIKAPVKIISTGLTASAATLIMLAAEKGNRMALPNARIMIHQPTAGVRGTVSDIQITAEEIIKLRERANKIIAEETGQPLEKVQLDTDRDFWLSPEEAKDYGIIGKIVKSLDEI